MASPSKGPPAAGGGKGDPGGRKAEGKLVGILKRNPAAAVGTAGVGAVVIIALMMRRGSSAQDPGAVSSSDLQKFGGISGLYDTTANDVYNSINSQLQAMQDAIAQLQDGTKTPAPAPAPKPAPKPKPKPGGTVGRPKPKPKPPSNRKYITIKRGDTLSGIASRSHISMSTLKKLNPVFWTNPKYHSGNLIWSGGKVRVK